MVLVFFQAADVRILSETLLLQLLSFSQRLGIPGPGGGGGRLPFKKS